MSSNSTALAARIRTELAEMSQVVRRAEHLLAKASQHNDDDYLDGIALNLHSFYTGVEHIFEEIAKEIEGAVPSGSDWHRSLLMQMSAEIPQLRPPVVKRSTRALLDEYRGFRHVIRNIYTLNIRPDRLQTLVAELPVCYEALREDVQAFCDFLEDLSADA